MATSRASQSNPEEVIHPTYCKPQMASEVYFGVTAYP